MHSIFKIIVSQSSQMYLQTLSIITIFNSISPYLVESLLQCIVYRQEYFGARVPTRNRNSCQLLSSTYRSTYGCMEEDGDGLNRDSTCEQNRFLNFKFSVFTQLYSRKENLEFFRFCVFPHEANLRVSIFNFL